MITTLTDGIAILVIRHRFFEILLGLAGLLWLFTLVVVLPLAVVGGGVWWLFFSASDEVPTAHATPAAIEATAAPDVAEPVQVQPTLTAPTDAAPARGTTSAFASSNAALLETNPPKSRGEHLEAAIAAVRSRQGKVATYEIKMVMQYDLQKGRALSQEIRDVMRDGVFSGIDSGDIGNFVTLASEKYKSQWSQAERSTYERMRSIIERDRD